MNDKPTKPVYPGPMADPAAHATYAQDNATWSDWVKDHPEDAEHEAVAADAPPPNPNKKRS